MRRSRRLTHGEHWELGLFLAILTVGCVVLTALLGFNSLPAMFAQNTPAASSTSPTASPISFNGGLSNIVIAAPQPTRAQSVPPVSSIVTPSLPPARAATPIRPAAARKPAEDIRWYKGVAYHYVKTMKLRVTAYAPDSRCCWPYPGTTTASGQSVKANHGRLVAADTRLIPMHALVAVPGYSGGSPVPVLDRGGAIKGHRLDVLLPTFNKAREWGTRTLAVRIYLPVN